MTDTSFLFGLVAALFLASLFFAARAVASSSGRNDRLLLRSLELLAGAHAVVLFIAFHH